MIQIDIPNPLKPATTASIDEIMNGYHQRAQGIRGEHETQQATGEGFNPYQPQQQDTQQDAQQAHASAMEQALAPIPHNQYDVTGGHTEERQKMFESRVEQDPAMQEIAPGLHQMAEVLRQGVLSGQIDLATAQSMGQSWLQDHAKPAFEKHHTGKKWLEQGAK